MRSLLPTLLLAGCVQAERVARPEGEPVDASPDAAPADASPDAALVDASLDEGPVDASPDAAPVDASPDAAPPRDAARPDAGPPIDAGALTFHQVDRGAATLILLLDASGSMGVAYGDGSRLDRARAVIDGLLAQAPIATVGLVVIGGDLLTLVAPAHDHAGLRAGLRATEAGGASNFQAAFDAAQRLYPDERPAARFALLLSDGSPTAGGDPIDAAVRLWRAGVVTFTVNIGGGRAQRDLLADISGSLESPHDAAYVASPLDDGAVDHLIAGLARQGACVAGPVPPDCGRLEVALVGDAHVPLTRWPVGRVPDDLAFACEPARRALHLGGPVCDAVEAGRATLTVRVLP